MDGETEKSRIGVRVTAATISKVGQTGASTLNTSTSLSCKIRVTASNGWYHDFDGVIIGAVPAYDAGYNKANSLYTAVSIYEATTGHKIIGVSGTNIGTTVAVTDLKLWSEPNNPSSAKTYHTIAYSSGVYRAGSAYTHYVADKISSNTTLYER